MCDNDYDYELVNQKLVKIRRPRECGSCFKTFPVGTKMLRHAGKTDGEFGVTFGCPVCTFGHKQPDHSDLHLCWGWNWDHNPEGELAWDYIDKCFSSDKLPDTDEFKKLLEQHRVVIDN